MSSLLELDGVGRSYGALDAVSDVSLNIEKGARLGIIGPNGAGKTTLFGLITGRIRCSSGRIRFEGRDITRASQPMRTRLGIALSFQHSILFPSMSCEEAVIVATQRVNECGERLIPSRARTNRLRDQASEYLELVGLLPRASIRVHSLSHGEKRQLDVAVALACAPRLLLLDEPTAGLSSEETARFVELIARLPTELALALVEHDMEVVFGIAERVTVLQVGRVLETGTVEEIRRSPIVEEAYLGVPMPETLVGRVERA